VDPRGDRCEKAEVLDDVAAGLPLGLRERWLLGDEKSAGAEESLEMTTLDPAQDHWRIATTYTHEATAMRQKAEELFKRAAHYERLFGPDSEWVTGTRLSAQFYEDVARERERLAEVHVGLAGGHGAVPPPRLDAR